MASGRAGKGETIEPNVAAAETRGAAQNPSSPTHFAPRPNGTSGRFFEVDPAFLGVASVKPYERKRRDPLYRPLRIYTLDPNARRLEGAVATVNIPFEPLEPGPKGTLLEVVDQDVDTGLTVAGVDLDDRRVLIADGREPSLSDHLFHQQMVYAVCTSTYNVFRSALGRDPAWGFAARPGAPGPVLRIRPHAFKGQNAYYDPDTGTLDFGYFDADAPRGRNLPRGRVFACLSHDIIAHEMTHALLDGMRAWFRAPTNPDVLAFHEGFADLVAIFLHFSYREVVQAAIERTAGNPENDNLLLSVAQQFGQTMARAGDGAAGPLRSAIDSDGWGNENAAAKPKRYDEVSKEPHELGRLLVSAVFEAFAVVFRRRTRAYHRLAGGAAQGGAGTELAGLLARQASELATQFLSICIRAIDYCPPIDMRLGEYLRALITADFDLVPDDPFAYREALIDAFAQRGIYPDDIINLSEDALLWHPPPRQIEPIAALHFAELRFAGDPGRAADEAELRRQAEAVGAYVMRPGYADLFGCTLPGEPALEGDRVDPARVCSVRSLRRIGPDREVTFEIVFEIVQRRWLTGPDGRRSEFYGGCTAVVGADGSIRYLISKRVTDRRRAERQAQYLAASGPGWTWIEQGNRRYLPQSALRQCMNADPRSSARPGPRKAGGETSLWRRETVTETDKLYEALSRIAEAANAAVRQRHGGEHFHDGESCGRDERPSCTIKILPERLRVEAADTALRLNPANGIGFASITGAARALGIEPQRILVMVQKYWGPQQRQLTVSFMEQPRADLRNRILLHMNAWSSRCGISFVETSGVGQVRISLRGSGYWSYLGTDILHIPQDRPTMNLENFSMSTDDSEYHRVVRHETGHTLGFPHEHMRRELVAQIDPEKAYDYFWRTQGWDRTTVDQQVLTPLDQASIMGTSPDQDSIMCYQLPREITKDGKPITGGIDIDETDYGFAARIYPKPGAPHQQAVESRPARVESDAWDESEDVDARRLMTV